MIQNGNLTPGNAGFMLWLDILLPVIGLALLGLSRRRLPSPARPVVEPDVGARTIAG